MDNKVYQVLAHWDDEAGVWVAESEDVPGLVAEAASPSLLREKLLVLIPELLELNGVIEGNNAPVQFNVSYRYDDRGVIATAS